MTCLYIRDDDAVAGRLDAHDEVGQMFVLALAQQFFLAQIVDA